MDFTSVSMMVIFTPGVISTCVSVQIVDDDVAETSEIFTGTLTANTKSVVTGVETAEVTIIDNDSEFIVYSPLIIVHVYL